MILNAIFDNELLKIFELIYQSLMLLLVPVIIFKTIIYFLNNKPQIESNLTEKQQKLLGTKDHGKKILMFVILHSKIIASPIKGFSCLQKEEKDQLYNTF